MALLRDHGSAAKYVHEVIGTNERLDAIQAAVLNAKLPYLEAWTEARRRHAAAYTERLKDVPGVTVPVELPAARHVYHIYCIRVPGNRDAIKAALNQRGIGAGIHYPIPVHLQPALATAARPVPEYEAAADDPQPADVSRPSNNRGAAARFSGRRRSLARRADALFTARTM